MILPSLWQGAGIALQRERVNGRLRRHLSEFSLIAVHVNSRSAWIFLCRGNVKPLPLLSNLYTCASKCVASRERTLTMSMIATAVKVVSLTALLTCVGSVRPAPDAGSWPRRDAASATLKCRHYFGCAPIASAGTTVAQRQ